MQKALLEQVRTKKQYHFTFLKRNTMDFYYRTMYRVNSFLYFLIMDRGDPPQFIFFPLHFSFRIPILYGSPLLMISSSISFSIPPFFFPSLLLPSVSPPPIGRGGALDLIKPFSFRTHSSDAVHCEGNSQEFP